jgi:hypothetical protein
MGGRARIPEPRGITPATARGDEPALLARPVGPGELFGPNRMQGVDRERQSAAAQIQRTLRVWRKASGDGEVEKESGEVSEPGEPAEQEADAVADKVAGEIHGDSEKAEAKDKAAEEKAPQIGAKLDGVDLKVYRGKKDRGDDDKLEVTEKIKAQMEKAKLPYLRGGVPFVPKLFRNDRGEVEILKLQSPRGTGWTAADGKIWIRGRAHAGYPDHWDVQESVDAKEGEYQNVLESGEAMTKEHQKRGN